MELSMFMRNDWKLLLLVLHDATESVIFTNVLWYLLLLHLCCVIWNPWY